jgi:Fur family ferric uptake transcriptional regulator
MNNKKAHEEFTEFLRGGKHRITPERFEVLDFALSNGEHYTADALYLKMKEAKSNISRATVYNSLELLVKCRMLAKRNFGENRTLYESSYNKQNHVHIICRVCGVILESDNAQVAELVNKIAKRNNFKNESFQFNIFGTCKKHSK